MRTGEVTRLPSPALPLVEAVARVGASAAVQPSYRPGYTWLVTTTSCREAQAIAADLLTTVQVPELTVDGVEVHVRLAPAARRPQLVTS